MNTLTSKRLSLSELSVDDSDFIFELVNTPDWIRFIGDRNVKSKEDAIAFVTRVINNPNVNYWVVKTNDKLVPIGIISFVKRDYLDFFDLGFAFLPNHAKQGYAFEAASIFLENAIKYYSREMILATTVKDNFNSIALLVKLGFQFDKQIEAENEELLLYSILINKLSVK